MTDKTTVVEEKKSVELTKGECNVILGLIQHAVVQGLPNIQDANNAVIMFGKLAQLFPPEEPKVSEGEIEEKAKDSE